MKYDKHQLNIPKLYLASLGYYLVIPGKKP